MSGAPEFAELTASCLDQRWHFDPVEASAQGLAAHDARLGDFGPERIQQHLAGLKAMANALEDLELDDRDDEIDRTALLNDLRVQYWVWTADRPHQRDPGFWVNHLFEGLYHLLAARDRDEAHRRDALAARLEAAPGLLAAAEHTLAECPRPFVETAIQMLAGGRQLVAEAAEAAGVSGEGARGALDHFQAHVQGTLLDPAGEEFAIGSDQFNFLLSFRHAVRATASEILRYGTALVEEVTADLERMAGTLSPGTPWPALLDQLREEHPLPGALVQAYRTAMERARVFTAEHGLVTLPSADLDVVATPAFLTPMFPYAAYQPAGAFGADRLGRFYVTEPEASSGLRDHSVHEIPVTALHEGWPGHHLQLSTALGLDRTVRRLVSTPVTVEGWALYCEEMMADEGFLTRREERFFQRVALLFRALRIVIDVGLHTQEVTRTQAVDLLVDRIHMDRSLAQAEVRRYAATPTYQLAYAIGRRELRGLRRDYQAAQGDRFDLRGFHDALLGYGGLPVSLIRWGLDLDA